jgi:hypothetical protein
LECNSSGEQRDGPLFKNGITIVLYMQSKMDSKVYVFYASP